MGLVESHLGLPGQILCKHAGKDPAVISIELLGDVLGLDLLPGGHVQVRSSSGLVLLDQVRC